MDAFGSAHRKHASTYGVAKFASEVCLGFLFENELKNLVKLSNPQRPMLAIFGGSKVSTKLNVILNLAKKVDNMIVGGGIANTFILAAGFGIGKSICEPNLVDLAKQIMQQTDIILPKDVVIADDFNADATPQVKAIDKVADNEYILDIGPKTSKAYHQSIQTSQSVIWNGPVGLFEWQNFSSGTRLLAQSIADSKCFSVAGGGDTIAAIDDYDISKKISFISTGGGAFLEYLEKESLPILDLINYE